MSTSKVFFVYATPESANLLSAERFKALALGSDFGYGNFGDLLQHYGALDTLKRTIPDILTVSLVSVGAIPREFDAVAEQERHRADILAYVSDVPINRDELERAGLISVPMLRNFGWIYMYGGGFLNELWGNFVISVAEFFLSAFPKAQYVISGQQVSASFADAVESHINRHKPALIGLRDQASLDVLASRNVQGEFSFDDAIEEIGGFIKKLRLSNGTGAVFHLNSSDYTGNSLDLSDFARELDEVRLSIPHTSPTHVFQAYRDRREEVSDSIETIKQLESGFPFPAFDVYSLVPILQEDGEFGYPPVAADFGYSSSYHVTLLLQMAGIPCWLRARNPYYKQKQSALGLSGSLSRFLASPYVPDHSVPLERRSAWLARLKTSLTSHSPVQATVELKESDKAPARLQFKGEPTYRFRFDETWRSLLESQAYAKETTDVLEALKMSSAASLQHVQSELAEARSQQASLTGQLNTLSDVVSSSHTQFVAAGETIRRLESERETEILDLETRLGQCEKSREQLEHKCQTALEQITEIGNAYRATALELEANKAGWLRAIEGNHELERQVGDLERRAATLSHSLTATEQTLEAHVSQITELGHEVRTQLNRADIAESALAVSQCREAEAQELIHRISASKSWQYTRPARVLIRYLRVGRFDEAGEIGLFEAARRGSHYLPIPAAMRSRIGRVLARFRRL